MEIVRWFANPERSKLILLLEDFHPFLRQEQFPILRLLREATRIDLALGKTLIIQSLDFQAIKDLDKEVPILELPLPDRAVLRSILRDATADLAFDDRPVPDSPEEETLLDASLGLSNVEARWTYRRIIARQGRLREGELGMIISEKEQIIKKGNVLEYFHPEGDFGQVGGLEALKSWLVKRGKAFTTDAKSFGLTSPKGVLLLGIPGCGKSLVAKTIANEWKIPLLKFDLGKVFAGIVGESESNIRQALALAEAIAPSILWVDEIEKGLGGLDGRGDSGTSSRVFGTLLTWMQEKKSEVFVIATANNIELLPPELLRKGRFDEIFFVDLPNGKEREEILRIHLSRKKRKPDVFNLAALAEKSVGFSGAELEEAVAEALFSAYNKGGELGQDHLQEAIERTFPLSQTMKTSIDKLRLWARVRARLASVPNEEKLPDQKAEVPQLRQERRNIFTE